MKGNELVWRAVCDAALEGRRRWASTADLAFEAGVPRATAAFALQRLTEVGAIESRSSGGFSTVNPEKALTLLAAWRNLDRDTITMASLGAVSSFIEQLEPGQEYALGGADAAVHYLGGRNTVADIGTRLVYLRRTPEVDGLPAGGEVRVMELDERAARGWINGYSSLAQTYADLFATPGWQAEEFRRALWTKFFAEPDWEQGKELSA